MLSVLEAKRLGPGGPEAQVLILLSGLVTWLFVARAASSSLDALNRHRGKGQQKVTVEHVHVNAGGQAIVGVVHSPEATSRKSEKEADAARAIAYAPDTALRCSDPERDSVPVAGGARKTPL